MLKVYMRLICVHVLNASNSEYKKISIEKKGVINLVVIYHTGIAEYDKLK